MERPGLYIIAFLILLSTCSNEMKINEMYKDFEANKQNQNETFEMNDLVVE